MRTVVIGLGSPILSDDSVGLRVIRELSGRNHTGVTFVEAHSGGLSLLEEMTCADRVILVDASLAASLEPGEVSVAGICSESLNVVNSHDCTLEQTLLLGRTVGLILPPDDRITVVAIGVKDVSSFGETLSPVVAAAIPVACATVIAILEGAHLLSLEAVNA